MPWTSAIRPVAALPGASPLLLAGGFLAGLAAANAALAAQARRETPPAGSVLRVNGVAMHVLDVGVGDPVLLLHGNGSLAQDFVLCGLVGELARTHRVIVPDRPGYGYSARPRDRVWTPEAQADLIRAMLHEKGIGRVTVLGHSFGTLVAIALAHRNPGLVTGLVLASGYLYPTARADVPLVAAPAVPVVGDAMSATTSPVLTRLLWNRIARKLFAPAPVADTFRAFPVEMAARPSQLHAAAADVGLMIPAAERASRIHDRLQMPLAIVAGAGDRIVDPARHSARLHAELPHSTFRRVRGAGHMVHHTAPDAVLDAIASVTPARGGA